MTFVDRRVKLGGGCSTHTQGGRLPVGVCRLFLSFSATFYLSLKMAAVHLRIGDLVWGKLGRYPPWPGKIVSPPKDLKKPRGKKCHFVKFFGTEDHAWIKVEQLKPYHAHKEEMIKINKGKRFQQAVDAVEDYLKKAKGKEQVLEGCFDCYCNVE
ncbi:putative oxidoreductase glyr1 [Ataeniobius toweri]|uniref:Oxidoreductase glyr1 n=1 Tax=Ataeniobius toweri TaxID=208326 RepID=A0ABU7BUI4_9TELE|nr:putative oxidoreductase glyr1 [Ataeniobius toweri]